MSGERLENLPTGGIPQADRSIGRAGSQQISVRRPGYSIDDIAVAQPALHGAIANIPQTNGLIERAGGQQFAVIGKIDAHYDIVMPLQYLLRFARVRVPDTHRFIV